MALKRIRAEVKDFVQTRRALQLLDENIRQLTEGDSEIPILFTDLTDTPANYSGDASKFVKVNVGETALEFVTAAGAAITFLDLTDTPGSYSSQADKLVAVNSGETAVEFVASPSVDGITINALSGILQATAGVVAGSAEDDAWTWASMQTFTSGITIGDSPTITESGSNTLLITSVEGIHCSFSNGSSVRFYTNGLIADAHHSGGLSVTNETSGSSFGSLMLSGGDTGTPTIFFADTQGANDSNSGQIQYSNSSKTMTFKTNGLEAVEISVTGVVNVSDLTSTGSYGAVITDNSGDLSFVDVSGASANDVLSWDGANIVWAAGGGGGGGAPTDAEYVVLSTDATLTNERVLTAGDDIDITDAGAGSTVTIDLEDDIDVSSITIGNVSGNDPVFSEQVSGSLHLALASNGAFHMEVGTAPTTFTSGMFVISNHATTALEGAILLTGGATGIPAIWFADSAGTSDPNEGRIDYVMSSREFNFRANGVTTYGMSDSEFRPIVAGIDLGTDASRFVDVYCQKIVIGDNSQGATPNIEEVADDIVCTLTQNDKFQINFGAAMSSTLSGSLSISQHVSAANEATVILSGGASGVPGVWFVDSAGSADTQEGRLEYSISSRNFNFYANGTLSVVLDDSELRPSSSGAIDLGTTSEYWGSAYVTDITIGDGIGTDPVITSVSDDLHFNLGTVKKIVFDNSGTDIGYFRQDTSEGGPTFEVHGLSGSIPLFITSAASKVRIQAADESGIAHYVPNGGTTYIDGGADIFDLSDVTIDESLEDGSILVYNFPSGTFETRTWWVEDGGGGLQAAYDNIVIGRSGLDATLRADDVSVGDAPDLLVRAAATSAAGGDGGNITLASGASGAGGNDGDIQFTIGGTLILTLDLETGPNVAKFFGAPGTIISLVGGDGGGVLQVADATTVDCWFHSSDSTTGPGGLMTIRGGDTTNPTSMGGSVIISAGAGNTSGIGGLISITAGTGGATGAGSDVIVSSGSGNGGAADGNIELDSKSGDVIFNMTDAGGPSLIVRGSSNDGIFTWDDGNSLLQFDSNIQISGTSEFDGTTQFDADATFNEDLTCGASSSQRLIIGDTSTLYMYKFAPTVAAWVGGSLITVFTGTCAFAGNSGTTLGSGSSATTLQSSSSGISFNISGTEMTLTSNDLTFNNGATDTNIGWTTSGQLDLGIGGTIEMSLAANSLSFNSGTADPAWEWPTDGQIDLSFNGTDAWHWDADEYWPENNGTQAIGKAANKVGRFHMAGMFSVSIDSDSTASSAEFNILDEDNYSAFAKTDLVSADGVTYTQSTGNVQLDETGRWIIHAVFLIGVSGTALVDCIVKLNGTPHHTLRRNVHSAVDPVAVDMHIGVDVTSGDDITFHVDSTTAINVTLKDGSHVALHRIS